MSDKKPTSAPPQRPAHPVQDKSKKSGKVQASHTPPPPPPKQTPLKRGRG